MSFVMFELTDGRGRLSINTSMIVAVHPRGIDLHGQEFVRLESTDGWIEFVIGTLSEVQRKLNAGGRGA